MKRFLLFGGDRYYPCGGWIDLVGSFDSKEEAKNYLSGKGFDWAHVVDQQTMKEVWCSVEGEVDYENGRYWV